MEPSEIVLGNTANRITQEIKKAALNIAILTRWIANEQVQNLLIEKSNNGIEINFIVFDRFEFRPYEIEFLKKLNYSKNSNINLFNNEHQYISPRINLDYSFLVIDSSIVLLGLDSIDYNYSISSLMILREPKFTKLFSDEFNWISNSGLVYNLLFDYSRSKIFPPHAEYSYYPQEIIEEHERKVGIK